MMSNDVSSLSPGQESPNHRKKWLKKIGRSFTHQWGWKLTSLVLAVCLWGALISQDTSLPRDKVIDGVRITVSNANTLRSNGLIVVGGLENLEPVRLKVRVPQRYYSTVTAANYTVRLDLGQIQATGEQTLKLAANSTNVSMYGTVTDLSLSEMTVQVEEYASQSRVPVEVRIRGDAPEGYYLSALSLSTQYVDIGGPRSIVEAAARCVVEYDQSGLSPLRNPNASNLAFFFEDLDGHPLDDTNLTVTASGQSAALQKIGVSQYAYPMVKVPINTDYLFKGEVAEGYRITDVQVSPESITLAGSDSVIAPYVRGEAALYSYEQVDVSQRRQSFNTFLTLRIPANMEYVSSSVVQLSVTIAPVDPGEPAS